MKLWITIKKDLRILLRDRIGLTLMFAMPIVLVIVVTIIQNNTFDLLSTNKVKLLVCNKDTGKFSGELIEAIDKIGMFSLVQVPRTETGEQIIESMQSKDALLGVVIPAGFSDQIDYKAKNITSKALTSFGLEGDSIAPKNTSLDQLQLYYKPEIQPSFKLSIEGALASALQTVQSRQVLRALYYSINEKVLPDSLEKEMLENNMTIDEVPISKDDNKNTPNATQHNIPAWTIFAMFFVVMSLGGSIVREKLNGSFIRLKTLPTNYAVALFSKQLTYLLVTLLQAAVIFSIGVWLFPYFGLPGLNIPADLFGIFIVTLICGWCAVSYAICVGVFARTQEQANGFGAVSIVILAVIGGLMVPGFAMPHSFSTVMKISPLHWCLQSYYGLFLEGGRFKDVWMDILPILLITFVIQLITFVGLKRKNLI